MGYVKIKLSGIYKIEHIDSGMIYIGKSLDIFSRWSSHYTNVKFNKHTSPLLQQYFTEYTLESFNFTILEYVSKTEHKEKSKLKGKEFKKYFNTYLHSRERYHMSQHSINLALNKNNKQFSK